jgi:hypothetical protein
VEAMDDLKKEMSLQIEQVHENVAKTNDTSIYWDFANKVSNKVCATAKEAFFESYIRWINIYPVYQIFLKSENQIHKSIYHNAELEGNSAFSFSHLEIKNILQVKLIFVIIIIVINFYY